MRLLQYRHIVVPGSPKQDPGSNLLKGIVNLEDSFSEHIFTCLNQADSPVSTISLNEQVRIAMRRVAHPLMVITALNEDRRLVGLLVSSFNTVTIEPEPIVSFNLKLPSSTYDAITLGDRFSVTALSTVQMAKKFLLGTRTQNGRKRPNSNLSKWRRVGLFHMQCEWIKEKSVHVGENIIMVGRVRSFLNNADMGLSRMPLNYAQGRYIQFYGKPSIQCIYCHSLSFCYVGKDERDIGCRFLSLPNND